MTKVEAVKEFSQAIATEALTECEDCGHVLKPEVLRSNAGCYLGTEYYIGTECYCGPYSRESGYYRTYKQAESDLVSGEYYLQSTSHLIECRRLLT
jgi:predicted nucleic acid-binding Zn ribbon protein